MRFAHPASAILFTASLVDVTHAWARLSFNLLGYAPRGYFGNTKRDLDSLDSFSGLGARDFGPEELSLEKREATCDCVETMTVSYGLSSTESYMATPFGECNPSAATSNLCPIDFNCVCENEKLSRCLPTKTVKNVECTKYTGPSDQPAVTFWWLSSTLDYGAAPSGQCGGTKKPAATTSWNPHQTECPDHHACACKESGYSVCVDTTASDFTGTTCPNTCKYEFKISLPPPTATAKIGGQCGGKCWTGPTNCPASATCFTETSPIPGAYAMCHTVKPKAVRKLRLRDNGDEGINVPAKVQAMATPIYF